MIIVNTDMEKFISGSYNGTNFRIPFSESMYKTLKELETKANKVSNFEAYMNLVTEFENAVNSYDYHNDITDISKNVVYLQATGKYHLRAGKKVVTSVYIPDKIMDIILSNMERKIEIEPMVKLCMRFILNPIVTQSRFDMLANYITQSYTDTEEAERLMDEEGLALEVAEEMATYSDIQITSEGYLRTSKVAKEITKKWSIKVDDNGKAVIGEDGKPVKELVDRYAKSYEIDEETGEVTENVDYPEYLEDRKFTPAIYTMGDNFNSGGVLGYKYEIGKVASLPSWDLVNMTDDQKHEKGLHTGGLRYIEGYNNDNREILDVFVCPSMIGKFTDAGLGEMTCKEFFIYGASRMKGNLRSMYHTSSYTTLLKEELSNAIDEGIREVTEDINNISELADETIEDATSAYKELF